MSSSPVTPSPNNSLGYYYFPRVLAAFLAGKNKCDDNELPADYTREIQVEEGLVDDTNPALGLVMKVCLYSKGATGKPRVEYFMQLGIAMSSQQGFLKWEMKDDRGFHSYLVLNDKDTETFLEKGIHDLVAETIN